MEQELRNKVKEAAKEYYAKVYGSKREFDYIPPSGKLLGEEETEHLIRILEISSDMNNIGEAFKKYVTSEGKESWQAQTYQLFLVTTALTNLNLINIACGTITSVV